MAKVVKAVETKGTIRDALVVVHNANNKRAINNKILEECGTTPQALDAWVDEIERKLYPAVKAYMDIKQSKDARKKTKAAMEAAFGKIMPIWAEICKEGSLSSLTEIKPENDDVESFVGWADLFIPSIKGTQRTTNSAQIFRKAVETLVGWKMAKNAALTEDDALIIVSYERAVKAVEDGELQVEEFGKRIAFINDKIRKAESDELKEYLTDIVQKLEHGNKDGSGKIVENGLEQIKEKIANAKKTIEETADKYLEITERLVILE